MVKPTVFSIEQDPKKEKQQEVHLISAKELPYKSGFHDEEPLITSRTQVCTPQRCACATVLILFLMACLIGAGIGLYLHVSEQEEPTMIHEGHPYGNDALYPPDYHKQERIGGFIDHGLPDIHHGPIERPGPFGPRPVFPGALPQLEGGPLDHDGLVPPPGPPRMRPHGGPPHGEPHAHGPHGREHGPGPHQEHGARPHFEHHHGGREPQVRHRPKTMPVHHGPMP